MKQKETDLNYSRREGYSVLSSDKKSKQPQLYSNQIQSVIIGLPYAQKYQTQHIDKRMSEDQSVFSFSDKKKRKHPLFAKEGQQKMMQSLPVPKKIGESRKIPLFNTLSIVRDQSPLTSPKKKTNFKKTYYYYQSNKPVHISEVLLKQREYIGKEQPKETKMHLRHSYFEQANKGNHVEPKQKNNFSAFLTKYQMEQKTKDRVNPETERKVTSSRRHTTLGSDKYLPPWMQELSQRLHDGGFRNDQYYSSKCRRTERMKRDYFDQIIKESHFASNILTPRQIESLFQQLKDSEPMPFWQSRVVDVWSLRLKKKNQYDKLRRSLEK